MESLGATSPEAGICIECGKDVEAPAETGRYCAACAEKIVGLTNLDSIDLTQHEGIELSPDQKQSAETQEALKRGFYPTKEVAVDGRNFLLSPVVETPDGRQQAILFTEDKGELKARLVYKSKSEGSWHAPDRVEPKIGSQSGFFYGKGLEKHEQSLKTFEAIKESREQSERAQQQIESHHPRDKAEQRKVRNMQRPSLLYGQQTRLVDQLQGALDSQEVGVIKDDAALPVSIFKSSVLELANKTIYENTAEFAQQLDIVDPPFDTYGEVTNFQPGDYVDLSGMERSATEIVQQLPVPDALKAALEGKPIHTSQTLHTELGKIKVEHFVVRDNSLGLLEWQFASDKEGRVWIQGIKPVESTANSFGVQDRLVDFGILLAKPLDYKAQTQELAANGEAVEFNGAYNDITPLLDSMPIVQAYRQARGVDRLKQQQAQLVN